MADTSIDQIRPVKQRRTGYDTSHWFDTPQYTKRDLATIALNARNEGKLPFLLHYSTHKC